MVCTLGAIGVLYGIESGSDSTGEAIRALLYCFVGIVAAVPIAFAINITRGWR